MKLFVSLIITLISSLVFAQTPLIIHGTEIGVGKFHRYDNKVHSYSTNNVWLVTIMPDQVGPTPVIYSNPNGSVTVHFSTLEELLTSVVKISMQRKQPVSVLNINGHGMPGGMWYPRDAAQLASPECASWRTAAQAPDKGNYDQYYTPVSKTQVFNLRAASQKPAHYSCVTGLPEWRQVVSRIPNIKSYFADDAQIHFLSCLVGLGPVGDIFTRGVGELLLSGKQVMVKSLTAFGLGDSSMQEGMGFWDYISDEQLQRDNAAYPVHRKDREIMQRGAIRAATHDANGWTSILVADQRFLLTGLEKPGFSTSPARMFKEVEPQFQNAVVAPTTVQIPGTGVTLYRLR